MLYSHKKAYLAPIFILLLQGLNAQIWEEQSLNGTLRKTICTRLVDWDDDGDLDIIGLESAAYTVTRKEQDWTSRLVWYKNDPTKSFPPQVILDHYLENPVNFEIVDFDHNGKKDVLLISNSITWFQNQHDGSFIQWTIKPNRQNLSYQVTDINLDGHMDVLTSFRSGADPSRVAFFLNDGKGNFREISMPNSTSIDRIQGGDLNNDGKTDLVATMSNWTTGFKVFYGKGELNYDPPVEIYYDAWDHIRDFQLKDYNLDGKLDISFALTSPRNDLIVLDGSQNFKANPNFKIPPQSKWVGNGYALPVDFNQDGYLDCLFTNSAKNGLIQVRYHDRSVETLEQGFKADWGSMMTTGDLDGDGDIDIVYAVQLHTQTNFTWFENINGEFYAHMIFGTYEEIHNIKIIDYDLDGDEDIFLSCAHEDLRLTRRNGVYLWENRGNGIYKDWFIIPLYHEKGGVQYLDIDQDGDIDIVGVSKIEGIITIYENNQAPNAWTIKNVIPKTMGSKISALSTLERSDILNWNVGSNKLDLFSKSNNSDLYEQQSLNLAVENIVYAELFSSSQSRNRHLIVLSRDTAQTLSVFEIENNGELNSEYVFKGYSSIAAYSFVGIKNQKWLVFFAKKSGKVELFVLLQNQGKFEVRTIYKLEQTSIGESSFSQPRVNSKGDEFYFRNYHSFYKIDLSGSTPFEVIKQNLPSTSERPIFSFAIGKIENGEIQQIVGSMNDGYISIFRKKP